MTDKQTNRHIHESVYRVASQLKNIQFQNKFHSQKSLVSEKILESEKVFGSEKNSCPKNFWSEIFGQKCFWLKKVFGDHKIFEEQKFFQHKNFFRDQKIVRTKNFSLHFLFSLKSLLSEFKVKFRTYPFHTPSLIQQLHNFVFCDDRYRIEHR